MAHEFTLLSEAAGHLLSLLIRRSKALLIEHFLGTACAYD